MPAPGEVPNGYVIQRTRFEPMEGLRHSHASTMFRAATAGLVPLINGAEQAANAGIVAEDETPDYDDSDWMAQYARALADGQLTKEVLRELLEDAGMIGMAERIYQQAAAIEAGQHE